MVKRIKGFVYIQKYSEAVLILLKGRVYSLEDSFYEEHSQWNGFVWIQIACRLKYYYYINIPGILHKQVFNNHI